MLTSIYFTNLPIIIKASEQHSFLNVCKWKRFSWTKLWKWRRENPLRKQEQTSTHNILPKKKEHFCDSKLLGDVFSWWLKTHPNLNHAISPKRQLWKAHLILEEMGQSYLLVLKDNFAVASRTHSGVWRSCYYSVFLVTQEGTQQDCDHGRPSPGSGLPPGKVQSQKPISVLLLANHHSSLPNQNHISKTLHPPVSCVARYVRKMGRTH